MKLYLMLCLIFFPGTLHVLKYEYFMHIQYIYIYVKNKRAQNTIVINIQVFLYDKIFD